LDTNDAKDEEDKKAQEQDITQHWKRVEQEHDQNSHTYNAMIN
jgi:hypothetical protein